MVVRLEVSPRSPADLTNANFLITLGRSTPRRVEQPRVEELYLANVPDKISVHTFWQRYFRQKARAGAEEGEDMSEALARLGLG